MTTTTQIQSPLKWPQSLRDGAIGFSRSRKAQLIDALTGTVDVTDTAATPIDATQEAVWEALNDLTLKDSVARMLTALGVRDRLALSPTLLASRPGSELVFGLVWRVEGAVPEKIDPGNLRNFGMPGHVKVIWNFRIRRSGNGSWLSMTTRFIATDEVTRARIHTAWGVVGPLSKNLSERSLAAVRTRAEGGDEHAA